MATGILSKGIKLGYSATKSSTYTDIPDLQEVPNLGGSAEKVEVTTLTDSNHRYINGIKDYGDLEFKFLYDNSTETSNYRVLKGLETTGAVTYFQVTFPDGTKFTFSGQVSTQIDSAAVNSALTFTATITLNSEIEVTNPAA